MSINNRDKIFGIRDFEYEHLECFRLGHEPQPSFGDQPQIGLSKEPVNKRSHAPFIRVSGRTLFGYASGGNNVSIGQNYFHAAEVAEMISVQECTQHLCQERFQ